MDRHGIADDLASAERSNTGASPVPYGWDDFDCAAGDDSPEAGSWIAHLQVIEVAAALGGLAALVGSLAPCFR